MEEKEIIRIPEKGKVLGVDVGWSDRNDTTGACVLAWNKTQISFTLCHVPTNFNRRREVLAGIVGQDHFEAVGIDGPLRPGFDAIGEYRMAELLLTRRFSNAGYGKPGQSNSRNGILLNEHANQIARSVVDAQCVGQATHRAAIDKTAVVEAFPTTFLAVMLDENRIPWSRQKSDSFFEGLLGPDSTTRQTPDVNRLEELLTYLLPNRRIVERLAQVTDHEHRAAVICAMTALCVACRDYVAVGDPMNGFIVLPPCRCDQSGGTQSWAITMINRNAHGSRDWRKDKLSRKPDAPHVIVETPTQVEVTNARYQ